MPSAWAAVTRGAGNEALAKKSKGRLRFGDMRDSSSMVFLMSVSEPAA
jgi:hypothetical protein